MKAILVVLITVAGYSGPEQLTYNFSSMLECKLSLATSVSMLKSDNTNVFAFCVEDTSDK